jgi:hypothetical protein
MSRQSASWWRIAGVLPLAAIGMGSIVATNDGNNAFAPTPVVTDESPAGIWQGTLTSDVTMSSVMVTAVIDESGAARLLLADGSQLAGSVATDGDHLTGDLTGITQLGSRWRDGTTVGSFTIDGTAAARATISGTYAGAGDTGRLTLSFDSVYDRASSFAALRGQWALLDAMQNYAATFSIDAQGTIQGSDGYGCIYSGSVTATDPTVNVYAVSLTVANCVISSVNFNGDYSGTGVLTDDAAGTGQNDVFVFGVDNGRLVVTMSLNRI